MLLVRSAASSSQWYDLFLLQFVIPRGFPDGFGFGLVGSAPVTVSRVDPGVYFCGISHLLVPLIIIPEIFIFQVLPLSHQVCKWGIELCGSITSVLITLPQRLWAESLSKCKILINSPSSYVPGFDIFLFVSHRNSGKKVIVEVQRPICKFDKQLIPSVAEDNVYAELREMPFPHDPHAVYGIPHRQDCPSVYASAPYARHTNHDEYQHYGSSSSDLVSAGPMQKQQFCAQWLSAQTRVPIQGAQGPELGSGGSEDRSWDNEDQKKKNKKKSVGFCVPLRSQKVKMLVSQWQVVCITILQVPISKWCPFLQDHVTWSTKYWRPIYQLKSLKGAKASLTWGCGNHLNCLPIVDLMFFMFIAHMTGFWVVLIKTLLS